MFALGSVAWAQPSEPERRAAARALFTEGLERVDAEQWEEAADRFRRAHELHGSPIIAYNLARALSELGGLVEATELLEAVLRHEGSSVELRHLAGQALDPLRPRLGFVVIRVDGHPGGTRVLVGGRELHDAQLGVAIPIDPGPRQVVLFRGDQELDRAELRAESGAELEVTLEAPPPPPPPTPAEAAATLPYSEPQQGALGPSSNPERDDGSVLETWWFWTAVGATVVGAVAVGVGVSSSSGAAPDPTAGTLGITEVGR